MSKRVIEGPTPYEMSPEQDEQARAMIEQAEEDLGEIRVNMRWGKFQIDAIRRAAARYGMPYQTYIRQAAFRQAVEDLKATESLTKTRENRARGA
ncbi:MAG: hypothetical protein EPO21_02015 [Chloroflexota bacterium]|nr:MAG: hypothetical protein EPO21_02015 [Chloroflexota bacterium]